MARQVLSSPTPYTPNNVLTGYNANITASNANFTELYNGVGWLASANVWTAAQTVQTSGASGMVVQNTNAGGYAGLDVKCTAGYAQLRLMDGTAACLTLMAQPVYGASGSVGFALGKDAAGNTQHFFIQTMPDATHAYPVIWSPSGGNHGRVMIGSDPGLNNYNYWGCLYIHDNRGSGGNSGTEIRAAAGQAAGDLLLKVQNQEATPKLLFDVDNSGTCLAAAHATMVQTLADGATITWDVKPATSPANAGGAWAQVTLGGNRAMANPTNLVNGAVYALLVIQDASGNRTLSFGSAFKFPAAAAPALSTAANAKDLLTFACIGGALYYQGIQKDLR